MEPFSAAPHHDVLELLVRFCILLFAARALGEIASRLGQPSVVGEILAGIVLGPSVLGAALPELAAWLVPEPGVGGYLLETISLTGALFLLLVTGLETDLTLIRRHARTAIGVSLGGILVTFSSGFLLGQWLPDDLLADPSERLVFQLFVATAMAISAIPVIAKVLMDLNLMRRDIGQTIIAAGMSDDTIGWMMLSVVAGIAAGGVVSPLTVLGAVGRVVAFMALSFTVGRWLIKKALDFVQDQVHAPDRLVTLVVVAMLASGAVSQALGLEAVLGAFVAGVLFGTMPRLPEGVHHRLMTIAIGVFTPVFFATAGLKVNVGSLLEPRLLGITLIVIAVASVGKVTGTYMGARLIGRRDHWTALSFGAGLNARGAMEIIIATIGLSLGILGQDMFSIIVVMAMATSLMAPPALRWVLTRVTPEEEELKRLEQEQRDAVSVIARVRRVLVPVRTRPHTAEVHAIEAFLLDRLSQSKRRLSATLFNVSRPGGKHEGERFVAEIAAGFRKVDITQRIVEGADAADEILRESRKDYDLMILGATEKPDGSDALFHPVVDHLVRLAPCPTVVVKRSGRQGGTWPPSRILVPTNGSLAGRRAAELAFRIASGESDEVIILHVVQTQPELFQYRRRDALAARQLETAHHIVDELRDLGAAQGIATRTEVRQGVEVEPTILALARDQAIDLMVIGTDVRPGSTRLFFGPRVERTLAASPCPVIVVNT